MKMYQTPIKDIEEYKTYFDAPENKPQIQVANEKTHYAWQNMSNYYYTAQVLRDGPIHEFPEKLDPAIGNISVTFADKSWSTVDDYFDSSTMDAMLVLHKGTIVHERYKTMRVFDQHIWMSCTKTTVATMLGMLEHEGKVDVSKYVTEYVPELAGSVWDTVTVEETLDMATGLDSTEHEVPDARTNPKRKWYQWAVSIGLFADTKNLNENPFDVLKRMERTKPGHTVYEYCSINPYICQRICENVTGIPLPELFAERIWRRIGAQGNGYYMVDKQGHALGFGFMNSTLRDLARYGLAFTPSAKKMSSDPIVPQGVIDKLHSGLRPDMYDKGVYGTDTHKLFPLPGIANRYQWDIITPDGDQFKSGVGGQGLYISAPHDAVVVFFSTGDQDDEARGAWVARTITQSFK